MNEDKINERAARLVRDYNITDSQLIRHIEEQIQQDEIENRFRTQLINRLKSVWELGIAKGLPQILTLLSTPTSWGFAATASGFVISAWEREQQNKGFNELKETLEKRIDEIKTKSESSRLTFDEFMERFIKVRDITSKSSSDLKRKALANLLVNSVLAKTEKFTGDETVLRLISQLSNEEMLAITAIDKIQKSDNSKQAFGVSIADIEQEMKWSEQETRIACEALLQLNLIFEPPISSQTYLSLDEPINVRRFRGLLISDLGNHLVKWCGEVSPTEQKVEENSGSAFLLSIAGIGTSVEDDLSERDEEILANEIDPIQGWSLKPDN